MAISQRKLEKLIAEVNAQSAELDRLTKEMYKKNGKPEPQKAKRKMPSKNDKRNPLAAYRLNEIENRIRNLPLNIMLVGPTGVGKSSTINALLGEENAKVGYGVNPETMETKAYRFNQYIKIWDTPGLGDSPEQDKIHAKKIKSLLRKKYKKDDVVLGRTIDLVLVIIDGSRRDIGTVFSFVHNIIMPEIDNKNILFIVNQADMAMKGRHFNEETGKPDKTLEAYLKDQSESIKNRIKESTGLTICNPIVYSATNRFNMNAILDFIIDNNEWEMRKFANHFEYMGSRYYDEDITFEMQKRKNTNQDINSKDFEEDDSIGDVIGNIVAAPLNGLAWGLNKVADFFDWLS